MRDVNSLNKVILIGRLGQKPELRVLPQGDRSMARFSLATNEKSFNPTTSESTIKTEWHKIVVWGKQAEFCDHYLDVGRQVMIEGKLRTRSWQDKDGNKRFSTEVEAINIVPLGRREGGSEGEHYERRPAGPGASAFQDPAAAEFPADEDAPGEPGGDDEVPF
ncbi:MAG: single-stranded DNA-binding protein [Acidobacteriota bacterium]|nr:single-stranded DNA-binding protein [Acidobacteriota bacterium]